jgi:hypothetical protein
MRQFSLWEAFRLALYRLLAQAQYPILFFNDLCLSDIIYDFQERCQIPTSVKAAYALYTCNILLRVCVCVCLFYVRAEHAI